MTVTPRAKAADSASDGWKDVLGGRRPDPRCTLGVRGCILRRTQENRSPLLLSCAVARLHSGRHDRDTAAGKKSRASAYKTITGKLGVLRMAGLLGWDMVLDLTRELDEWEFYNSPREARAAMRRFYTEDRWLGQEMFPILIVEKDTLEPVCKPIVQRWQMPFASSRPSHQFRCAGCPPEVAFTQQPATHRGHRPVFAARRHVG